MSSFTGKTVVELESWLKNRGIDTSLYQRRAATKSIESLLAEVEEGESYLSLDDAGNPVRDVSVVNVSIQNSQNKFLIEAKQILPSGATRQRMLALSEKMMPNEPWREAVYRGIREELLNPLNLTDSDLITIYDTTYTFTEERKESQSYPGLQTRYRCHKVNATVKGLPQGDFETIEDRDDGSMVHYWQWRKENLIHAIHAQ